MEGVWIGMNNDDKKNVAKEKLGETLEYVRKQITRTEGPESMCLVVASSAVNDILKHIESDIEVVMEELLESRPEEIVNARINLLEKRIKKLEKDILEINEEMSEVCSILHTISETSHTQLKVCESLKSKVDFLMDNNGGLV